VPPVALLLLPACRGGEEEWSGGAVCPASSKRWFLWFCSGVQQQFFPLTGHGGLERGERLLAACDAGGSRGEDDDELTHADGFSAITIYGRLGGRISTSMKEAWSRSSHGSSRLTHHEVMHSPWRVGGPWLQLVVGRGLPSCSSLLLGGDALRTPARGGGGALRLDCLLSFSSRVLYVKKLALSSDRRLPRTRLHKGCICLTFNI
jgi:hypothetical protein